MFKVTFSVCRIRCLLRTRSAGSVSSNQPDCRIGGNGFLRSRWWCGWGRCLFVSLCLCVGANPVDAQLPGQRTGEVIPRDVREMYDRGVRYLVQSQSDSGQWESASHQGAGGTAMAVMAMLASGEDPNYGLYAGTIRRGLQALLRMQPADTGYFPTSMYHHGFAMLCLAEAYGAVDDRQWRGEELRPLGQALELSVRAALTAQAGNEFGAWRYSPTSKDADTSVSGAVLMGLLAARNAGIEVPDKDIDRAIAYFNSMTSDGGQVGYSGGMGGFGDSLARSSIACLVLAVARRKDMPKYSATLQYLVGNLEQQPRSWPEYARYYQSQALFQGDVDAWRRWNDRLIEQLKQVQLGDGRFKGQLGPVEDTSLSLLALALNFRFLPIYER